MFTDTHLIEIDMVGVDGELHTTTCRDLNLTSLCDGGEACRLKRLRALVCDQLAAAGLQDVVQPFRLEVTLTGAASVHLAPHLPRDGELLVQDIGTDGHITRAVFRDRDAAGTLGEPVQVDFPQFTYQHKHTAGPRVS